MKLFLASIVHMVGKEMAKSFPKSAGRDILYISTAAEPYKNPWWDKKDKAALRSLGFKLEEYTLTGKTSKDVQRKLQGAKIICVGGGDTFYLLEAMKKSGAIKALRAAVKKGSIYIGSSAGGLVATRSIDNSKDLYPKAQVKRVGSLDALNFIDLCVFFHWGSKKLNYDQQALAAARKYRFKDEKIVFLRDDQYIEVQDDFYKIISVQS